MTAHVDKLKKQLEQLTARIQKAEALEKNKERKADARRKILVGAYYLDQAKQKNEMAQLTVLLDPFLTRQSDRALFNLPALAETENK